MFNKISDKFDSMNSVYDGNSIWVNDFDGTSARLVEQKGKIHQRMSEDDSWWNSDCPLVFCFLVSVFCLVIICSILLFENSHYYFMPVFHEKPDVDRHVMN